MKPVLKQLNHNIGNIAYNKLTKGIDKLDKKKYTQWSQYRQIRYHRPRIWNAIFFNVRSVLDLVILTKQDKK